MASLSTPTQPRLESTQHARATARKIIFIYVALACSWLLTSDALIATVFTNPQHLRQLNTFNSWFFVAGTAWLLYRLIRKLQIQTQAILEHEILAVKERMDNAERKAQATPIQSINKLDKMRRSSATPAHAPNPGRLAGLRMLVVDDHAVNREVVQRIFSREGAQVHTAADGQAAIDWLTRHKPPVDVVLMDIQMPHVNGYEATQKIRAIEHLKNLPVIALTAGVFMQHPTQAQQSGMNGYIVKPFDVDNAVQLILKLTAHAATPQHSAQPAPQPAPQPPDDNADLPGMAITKALATWLDASPYQNFLRLFANNYQHIAQELRQLPPADAQALAHKVRGAAANLGLTDVAAAAQQVERRLDRGEPWDDALLTLQQRMDIALESIRQYTLVTHPATPWAEPLSAAAQRSGLEKLLKAWQSDNAQTVEQALRVPGLLSHDANLRQQTALYSYDFRAGEAHTAALLQSLWQNP